jgi:hypothetical protein
LGSVGLVEHLAISGSFATAFRISYRSRFHPKRAAEGIINRISRLCVLLLLHHLFVFFRTGCAAFVAGINTAIDGMPGASWNKETRERQH